MNKKTLFFCFLIFQLACSKDSSTDPGLTPTSIEVVCNRDKGEAFLVEEEIVFSITMTTDPRVGINNFAIRKAGSEVFSKSDYTANIVNFTFTYSTTREDLDAGEVVFSFDLRDNDNQLKSQQLTVRVAVDLPLIVESINLSPGWDLVNDQSVSESQAAEADLFQFSVTINNFLVETYWTSLNGAKIYDVSNMDINFFDINLPYSDLENAIAGVNPVDTLLVSSEGTGFPVPLIVDIRNQGELILIDYSNVQASMIGYRKRD